MSFDEGHLELISVSDRPQHGGHLHTEFPFYLIQQLEGAEGWPIHLVHECKDGKLPQFAHLVESI